MATKTFEELKQLAIQIRDEKTNKQNTATRIGTQMLEHLDKLEQDYYDKTATDEELKERDEKLTELEDGISTLQAYNKIPIDIMYGKAYSTTDGALANYDLLDCTYLIELPKKLINETNIYINKKFFEIACFSEEGTFLGASHTPTMKLLSNTKKFSISFLKSDTIDYSELRIRNILDSGLYNRYFVSQLASIKKVNEGSKIKITCNKDTILVLSSLGMPAQSIPMIQNKEYEIPEYYTLIHDLSDNVVKVVAMNNVELFNNCIILAHNENGKITAGAFSSYFSSDNTPVTISPYASIISCSVDDNKNINITLQGTINVLNINGGIIGNRLESTDYSIPMYNTLIYDVANKEFKVVAFNSVSLYQECLILIHNENGEAVFGCVAEYVNDKFLKKTVTKDDFKYTNTILSSLGYLKDVTVKSDKSIDIVFNGEYLNALTGFGGIEKLDTLNDEIYNIPPYNTLIYDRDDNLTKVVALNNVKYSKTSIILLHNEDGVVSGGLLSEFVNRKFIDKVPLLNLRGKTVLFIGDSITEQAKWVDAFQKLTGCIVVNRGVSGTTITANDTLVGITFVDRLDKDPSTTGFTGGFPLTGIDLVIVLGGVNDWGRREQLGIKFGNIEADIDKTTFCGACRYLFKGLKERYANIPIIALSMLHTYCVEPSFKTWNEIIYTDDDDTKAYTVQKSDEDKSFYDYKDAVKQAANMFGIPFVDMFECGFSALVATDREKYYQDGLHPNDLGGYVMAIYVLLKIQPYLINKTL